jgi:type IV pilus assembly protein PilA
MRANRAGFTLVELLMVMVIIGLLAVIAQAQFGRIRERAYMTAMRSDLRDMALRQELFWQRDYVYSEDPEELEFTPSAGVVVTINHADSRGWGGTAQHVALGEDILCGVFFGEAPPDSGEPATAPGTIACDE